MDENQALIILPEPTWDKRAEQDGYENPMNDPNWPKGCIIIDYNPALPLNTLKRKPKKNQPRQQEKDLSHIKDTKNDMLQNGLKKPVYYEKATNGIDNELYHGHHRTGAAEELNWPSIAAYEVEFLPPGPGEVNPRRALNQYLNNHAPSLRSNKEDGVRFLNDVLTNDTYFDKAKKIADRDKRKAQIKSLAMDLLKTYYSSYSPQAKGSIFKRFWDGQNPSLMKPWDADKVWTTGNGLGILPARDGNKKVNYDTKTHCVYGVISHHAPDGVYGSIVKEVMDLKRSWAQAPGLNVHQHLRQMGITMVTYVEKGRLTKLLTKPDLDASRQECLAEIARLNKDTYTQIHIDTVIFMHQCLAQPAETVPMTYNWDGPTGKFVLQP